LRLRVLTGGVLRPGVAGEVGVFLLSATPTTAKTEPPQTHTRADQTTTHKTHNNHKNNNN
jgi:hypothetical protein